jgi:putative transposase
MLNEKYYERNLPHWQKPARPIFLTWRLYGSLPYGFRLASTIVASNSGAHFIAIDRHLDQAAQGPTWLKEPRIADLLTGIVSRGAHELKQYSVLAHVVMSNHVHLLLQPEVPLAEITKGMKGVSARQANLILGRTGKYFWHDESFDHWIRDEAEEKKVIRYIERNPVAAGLVKNAEDWPWSSARARI